MSESTKEQINEAHNFRDKYSEHGGSLYADELAKLIADVRAQATNDALERAALMFDQSHDAMSTPYAAKIRAMKVPT